MDDILVELAMVGYDIRVVWQSLIFVSFGAAVGDHIEHQTNWSAGMTWLAFGQAFNANKVGGQVKLPIWCGYLDS